MSFFFTTFAAAKVLDDDTAIAYKQVLRFATRVTGRVVGDSSWSGIGLIGSKRRRQEYADEDTRRAVEAGQNTDRPFGTDRTQTAGCAC